MSATTTQEPKLKIRHERRRGFQPPWYTVTIYSCPCGRETYLKNSWRGGAPRGAILCGCGKQLPIC